MPSKYNDDKQLPHSKSNNIIIMGGNGIGEIFN